MDINKFLNKSPYKR